MKHDMILEIQLYRMIVTFSSPLKKRGASDMTYARYGIP